MARTPTSAPDAAAMRVEVDTIRAIVCIILVLHHMVGISPSYGLELPLDHPISLLSHMTEDMRMPIFSFISGMVFARATGLWGDAANVVAKKARRLLLPMIAVGTLFWLARDLSGTVQPPLLTTYVTSFAHYWFLQASFVIMTAFVLLTCLAGGARHRAVAAGLGLLGLAWWGLALLPLPQVNWFSVVNAVFLLPFFMSGYLLTQTRALRQGLRRHPLARPLGALVLALGLGVGLLLASGALVLDDLPRRLTAIALGFVACFGLIALRPASAWWARIGAYSYAIYLFHVFFTAAATKAWHALGETLPLFAITALGVAFGILGPMAVQAALLRWPLAAFACLGLPLDRLRPHKLAAHPGAT